MSQADGTAIPAAVPMYEPIRKAVLARLSVCVSAVLQMRNRIPSIIKVRTIMSQRSREIMMKKITLGDSGLK